MNLEEILLHIVFSAAAVAIVLIILVLIRKRQGY